MNFNAEFSTLMRLYLLPLGLSKITSDALEIVPNIVLKVVLPYLTALDWQDQDLLQELFF